SAFRGATAGRWPTSATTASSFRVGPSTAFKKRTRCSFTSCGIRSTLLWGRPMSSEPAISTAAFGACPVPRPETERIVLAHGSGGLLTAQLIEEMILPAFRNPALELLDDQAILPLDEREASGERLAFTTDSYVVTPLF